MSSKVQICNMALIRIGASTITSLTDNTQEAILCNTLFNDLAREVMAEGSWTSTIRRKELARTTTTPSFEYTYEFQLPVDPLCLKVLNVNTDAPGEIDFRVEDDKLLCDESSIKIRYVAELTDTESWDIYLQRAFVARLASELAYPVTGSQQKSEAEFQRFRLMVQEGLALDGQQGAKEFFASTDLTDVR